MWETRSINLTVRLPRDLAAEAERIQLEDPEFLSRVVLYGLTRRSIYRHLRDGGDPEPLHARPTPDEPPDPKLCPGPDHLSGHELRILAENPRA